jgi:hypothetical protein
MQSISCVSQAVFGLALGAAAAAGKRFFIIYLAVAKRGSEYRWVDAEEMGL